LYQWFAFLKINELQKYKRKVEEVEKVERSLRGRKITIMEVKF
jgi:hypothetical protein